MLHQAVSHSTLWGHLRAFRIIHFHKRVTSEPPSDAPGVRGLHRFFNFFPKSHRNGTGIENMEFTHKETYKWPGSFWLVLSHWRVPRGYRKPGGDPGFGKLFRNHRKFPEYYI